MIKVQGHKNLFRDPNSKAIVNNDEDKRQQYLNQKRLAEINTQRYNDINNDIANIKSDMNDLKNQMETIIKLLASKGS